ncbi:unnamed protein product [Microthlaspi erraticum]|uniref:Ribosomal RNA small subunit methyltransferase NEP1 n=1 Tax=Microthlaspi erraticum TaxID=1685480 RepID=A0A6D2IWP4_9BRAS|nr:unnamed protein product [Microthlaspi erraticum]
MVRPYGIKVNKRKERQERYDKEEEEEEEQSKFERAKENVKKAKRENTEEELSENESEDDESSDDDDVGIPIVLADPKPEKEKPGVIFVLEKASLEVAKVGKTCVLLNSHDHVNFLTKNGRDYRDYRPDITHQALLMILDSPVNQAGRLKAVYVRTEKGVLFEVKPYCKLSKTYHRFAGLMLQLLQNLKITKNDIRETLMRVIKNPVEKYLPPGSRKIGFSRSSEKLIKLHKHLPTVCNESDTVFVLGAMHKGKIECDYIEDFVAVSKYPLTAAYCVSRICEALSLNWDIV